MPSDKQHREDLLDETIEESFPASDAPANTVETGTRVGDVSASAVPIAENCALSRFEFTLDGQTGVLDYERLPGTLKLMHTEVPIPLRHRGLGGRLVEAAILAGRADGLRIIAVCGFARAYMRRRPRA